MESQVKPVALPLRSHTILGICEAIGEDFGFNPIFLRVPLSAIVLYSPLMAVGAYFGLGLIVLASRLLFPARVKDASPAMNTGLALDATEDELPELARAA